MKKVAASVLSLAVIGGWWSVEGSIRKQQQKIDALKTISDDDKLIGEIDKPITEHEDIQLAKLQQSLTEARLKVSEARAIEDTARRTRSNKVDEVRVEIFNAGRDLDLAHAKLATAIEKTNQARADRQVAEAERDDRVFRTELERIKLTEVASLQKHDREYEIAQLQVKKTHQLVLDFDAAAREFQAEQAIVVSQKRSFKIYSITYAAGDGDTNTYLNRKEQLSKSKLQVFKNWAKLRSHISHLKNNELLSKSVSGESHQI